MRVTPSDHTGTALEGIRVLDVSTTYPGPYCSLLLADLGADVVMVEAPGRGDPMRSISQAIFDSVNRNKRSVTLDLKSESGLTAFYDLAEWADVVIEGFRPGVAARLGIDYATLSGINPKLIYCSISGYGQYGPYQYRTGHDLNYVAAAGSASVSGDPDGPDEWNTSVPVADIAGALFAANTILSSLIWRTKSDQGQFLDVSLTDAMVAMTALRIVDHDARGHPGKEELIAKGGLGIFKAADGKCLSVSAMEDKFFRKLCQAVALESLVDDPHYADRASRNRNWRTLNSALSEAFRLRDRDYWVETLTRSDVPCSPVNHIDELEADPQIRARSMLLRTSDGQLDVAFPIKLSRTPWQKRSKAPSLGEHTEQVFTMIGYDTDRIASLVEARGHLSEK